MAIAVLWAGNVPLLSLRLFNRTSASTLGFFYHAHAIWAGGLLPFLALLLTILGRRLVRPPNMLPTWIAACMGAVVGALVILIQHTSSHLILSLPHFASITEWWNAAFLIVESAFVVGSWVEIFRRIRASARDMASHVLYSPVTAGAVAITVSYSWCSIRLCPLYPKHIWPRMARLSSLHSYSTGPRPEMGGARNSYLRRPYRCGSASDRSGDTGRHRDIQPYNVVHFRDRTSRFSRVWYCPNWSTWPTRILF